MVKFCDQTKGFISIHLNPIFQNVTSGEMLRPDKGILSIIAVWFSRMLIQMSSIGVYQASSSPWVYS